MALGTGRQTPIIPANEAERLAAVRRYDILDTPPDGAFDRVATLAARLLQTPLATVTIVDEDRIWLKASHGVPVKELDRELGLCASAILQADPYVILDASVDPRSLSNPLVAGEFGLRFFVAAPLITSDGYRLGTLNVMDTRPREVSLDQIATLQDLAALVVDELELRLASQTVARMHNDYQELGQAFHESVLPSKLLDIPGAESASCYQPAFSGLVGGDFYDVLNLGQGRWGMLIGDVCGKGPVAAIAMSAMLHRIRVLARADSSPSQVLAELNAAMFRDGSDDRLCTVCYLVLKPGIDHLDLTFCSAGHPLPLVRRTTGKVEVAGTGGTIIGATEEPSLMDQSVRLEKDELLLLYTDGVVEMRRDMSIGQDKLREALSRCEVLSAHESLDWLEDEMEPLAEPDDDTAMVLLRVTGQPERSFD